MAHNNLSARERAANIMHCRLPWSTAMANARDLYDAGVLADRNELAVLRELAEWLVSLRGSLRRPDAAINEAIARSWPYDREYEPED